MNNEMPNPTFSFHNQFLGKVFNFFSLVFAFSVIGLAINLMINYELPISHLLFVAGMVVSLFVGVVVNIADKYLAYWQMQYQIKNLFN
ncbi:MAG: hypothetical protein MUE85_06945 [Microscillaceae bacterium]|jgi:hypothetical protein|nr:hypothetical protein [Microscillaceae bacterium]